MFERLDKKVWNDLRSFVHAAVFDVDKALELARSVEWEVVGVQDAIRDLERVKEALVRAKETLRAEDAKIFTGFKPKWRPKYARRD